MLRPRLLPGSIRVSAVLCATLALGVGCVTDAELAAWQQLARDADGDDAINRRHGGEDCDDHNPDVSPSATEQCDGIDNNCDGRIDEDGDSAFTYFRDADADGYGNPETTRRDCRSDLTDDEPQWVLNDTDCDDTRVDIHPRAIERCDRVDNDCDNVIDETCASPDLRDRP